MKSVSTASSKSGKRKKSSGRKAGQAATPAPPQRSRELSQRAWLISSLVVLTVAAILRLYHLELVPLHHDEGVNGNFLVSLVRNGRYVYDPQNYHGPTLYYFSAIIPWIIRFLFGEKAQNLYGLTTFNIRLITVLFGWLSVFLILLLRRRLGSIGALAAASLLAISPGAVYLSRYFIHESLFVFFTLGLAVAVLRYYEEAHPIYLVLAAASAALLFATKETAFISAGVLLIALGCTLAHRRLRSASQGKSDMAAWRDFLKRAGGLKWLSVTAVVGLIFFVGISVLFYSSFFTNYPKGVIDSLRTFQFWTKTGSRDHVHPLTTYVFWLVRQESPLLFLGTIGAVIVLLRPKNAFALFSAFWAFGLIAAYSLIGYKTPWLTLNFLVPLALIAGYVFQELYDASWAHVRELAVLGLVAVGISGYQTIDLNFLNYDNDQRYYVYVYAHTRRETHDLLREIDQIAARAQGPETGITIVSPDYWPLPWYLRDYKRVGYHGRLTESSEPIIIASESQRGEAQQRFGFLYQQLPGAFPLRPGVSLVMFVRRDASDR